VRDQDIIVHVLAMHFLSEAVIELPFYFATDLLTAHGVIFSFSGICMGVIFRNPTEGPT
jgi:hypothetical protein